MVRRRLDAEMVRRGVASSIEEALDLIDNRRVLVAGTFPEKPSRSVAPDEPIEIIEKPRYVSRGGEKLHAALDAFGISVEQSHVVDVGSSTGGFSDCLLQKGARLVTAIDVGTNQLHERLRADSRMRVYENTNVRDVSWTEILSEIPDLLVADLSFISLRSVASKLSELQISVIALIKPQFEATAAEASKGRGVISEPAIWGRTIAEVTDEFQKHGLDLLGLIPSPLKGAEGNVEFLAWFSNSSSVSPPDSVALRAQVVKRVSELEE